jgi:hypothetical protein
MEWDTQPPTKPGYYWLRLGHLAPQVVAVAMDVKTVQFVGTDFTRRVDEFEDLERAEPAALVHARLGRRGGGGLVGERERHQERDGPVDVVARLRAFIGRTFW